MKRLALVLLIALAAAVAAGCRLPRWRGASAADVASARGLTSQGLRAFQAGRLEDAEKAFRAALKKCPLDPQSHERFGDFLKFQGRSQEALAEYLAASRLAVDDPHVRLKAAEVAIELNNLSVAQTLVAEAIELQPNLPKAWVVRGRLLARRGEYRTALAAYSRALALAPDDQEARVEMARIHRCLGEPHKALVVLQALSSSFLPGETPAPILFELAQAYAEMGRIPEASEAALAAKRADPGNPVYDQFLAQLPTRMFEAQVAAKSLPRAFPQVSPADSVQQATFLQGNPADSSGAYLR
ncbi:MAG: tetratricopeptide repeat protein [Thermoguttaceae bacterium]|nr:tetratricopeptide repeat protein [Thermoguttaceae bacterium]